ncbi:sensor histidine kinase [Mycolicibacterium mageritense]|uniref:sensor histidine kinase n=1 Tax=Mycolicibacterium mageritense TaxID=53462 RepID=UPI0023F10CE5|nr:ATP-binding protein [Mycolicibacterium mageritense]
MRLQIGDMFETLSRRSRSLVEEQLALIEALELDEEDPARLEHLFRLDHLATRMRRNGDNLLVLADTAERHRTSGPVTLPDVLRAAMSEVEEYRRVQVGQMVDVSIVGAAAGDIGHLIAELLDNALRYSPPEAPVVVTVGRAVDGGVLVEVADRGLGMPKEDLTAANERLALGGEVTSETAKRMGLFVVGRLARRHDATVRLRTTAGLTDRPGVTASVHLPGALIAPPAGFVDPADDARTSLFSDTPRATGSGHALDRGLGSDGAAEPQATGSATASPAGGSNAAVHTARNGSTLPKRSPGASGVNGAVSSANGMTAPEPAPAEEPAPQARPNALSFFTAATATASTQSPAPAERASAPSARLDVESESAPIFERMTSEWLMDPTAPESRARAWVSATDAGWAAAANAVEQEPKRHTASGLPIRERGARLVPDDALPGSGARADVGKDPGAIRDILSRQLAGVRRGRAETDAADRRTEGDR